MSIEDIKNSLQDKGKCSFHVKVSPGSDITEWQESLADGTLKLKVKSAPERGQANDEVVSFVATTLGIKKKLVAITAGGGSRLKRIKAKLK
ncbi:MAG: DUF167 domain-containing protein [Patescibacteria group bacterium]|nr:DUF167 domain-containing protein [Patescibacteria group bacterium]